MDAAQKKLAHIAEIKTRNVATKNALKTFGGRMVAKPKSLAEKKAASKQQVLVKNATKANEKKPKKAVAQTKAQIAQWKVTVSGPLSKKLSGIKTASMVRPPPTLAQRKLVAKAKRAKISEYRKTKGKLTRAKPSESNKKVAAEQAIKRKEAGTKKASISPPTGVARIGRVQNAILIKMGFRDAPKALNLRRKATAPKEKGVICAIRKARKVQRNAQKQGIKSDEEKVRLAKIVKRNEVKKAAMAAANLEYVDPKKIVFEKKSVKQTKQTVAAVKKTSKPAFEQRKADGTKKAPIDGATRLARQALQAKAAKRRPKTRETYPTVDIREKVHKSVKHPKCCKLKESLKPGTVCIVLAGVNKGRRVIFLKQLPSGLCLINGPFTLNRVPMRRIAQGFLLATSARIHCPALPIKKVDDAYFARQKITISKKKGNEEIFDKKPKVYHVSKQRKNDQKKLDFFIMKYINIRKDHKTVRAYLATKFLLNNHDFPHAMKF